MRWMRTTSPTRERGARRGGFSLIEILIAILVLALGLLGLGAVFPAVIAEQRAAVDSTRGAAAAASAGALLRGGDQWAAGFDGRENAGMDRPRLEPWSMLSQDKYFSRRRNQIGGSGGLGSSLPTALWETTWNWLGEADGSTGPGTAGRFYDPYRNWGVIAFNGWDHNENVWIKQAQITPPGGVDAVIPVASRLVPPPFSGGDPRYVWDIVLRLQPASRRVEAAIFVRRVDTRIRASEQFSLSRLLTDGTLTLSNPEGGAIVGGTRASALPVAVDASGRPVAGDAPGGLYAMPIAAEIPEMDNGFKDEDGDGLYERIMLSRVSNLPGYPQSDETLWELAGQPGQKLVDNLGTVRTVVERDESDWIVVSPAYTEAQVQGGFAGSTGGGGIAGNTVDPSRAQQVVFTPQVPVAVEIVRVQE